jgi:predicted O-methyltransferase YrrM
MVKILKQAGYLFLPNSLKKMIRASLETKRLGKIEICQFSTAHLKKLKPATLSTLLRDSTITKNWHDNGELIERFSLPILTGGINPGDQRALYYLARFFKPKRILEIGTHIGCSTAMLALALKDNKNEDYSLTSLDIRDVNDTRAKPWLEFKARYSPAQLVKMIGNRGKVNFIVQDSRHYFKTEKATFDFIFIDGDHTAKAVYQEVPLALNHLNPEGVILLHDYYIQNKKLGYRADIPSGPFLALGKLIENGAQMEALPLNELPWQTTENSKLTSLTLLSRA